MFYNVWIEGFAIDRDRGAAQYLGSIEAETFKDACVKVLLNNNWEMIYYDGLHNTYWGCNFYDNEIDAKKNYG